MYQGLLLSSFREFFAKRRAFLSKEELLKITQKDTLRRKLQGFLTHDYHQRSKVVLEGEVVEGLVFKEWSEKENETLCWVLFSPSKTINEDPNILLDVGAKLVEFSKQKKVQKSEKQLQKALQNKLFDASFMELTPSLVDDKLIYLSKLEKPSQLVYQEGPGFYFFFINPSKSKEILFVPDFLIEEGKKSVNLI